MKTSKSIRPNVIQSELYPISLKQEVDQGSWLTDNTIQLKVKKIKIKYI